MTYTFSDGVRKSYFWLVVVSFVASAAILYVRFPEIYEDNPLGSLISLIVVLSFPATLFFRLVFVIRPHVFATYTPKQTHLLIHRGRQEIHIDYSQVTKTVWSWIPQLFGGGLVYHLKSGQYVMIPSLVEGYETLIQDYISFLPPNIVPAHLSRFTHRSSFGRCQRQRIVEILKNWKRLIGYTMYPVFVGGLLHYLGVGLFSDISLNVVLWTFLSYLVGVGIWYLGEFLFWAFHSEGRREKLEHGVYLVSRIIYLILLPTIVFALQIG